MSTIVRVKKVEISDTGGSQYKKDFYGAVDISEITGSMIIDGKIKVSANDTSESFLENKLTADDDVTLTVQNEGGNENIEIKTSGKARVTTNDTTFGYLDSKLVVGDYLTKTLLNGSANEQLEFDLSLNSFMGNHLGWIIETKSSASTRADETEFDVLSQKLLGDSGTFKNIQHIEDVSSAAGSMGTIENIGSSLSMSTDAWNNIHGLLLIYNCQADNWFNVKHNGRATDSDVKPIYTGTAANVNFIKKALFCYDKDVDKWHLLAWTPAKWKRRDTFSSISANTDVVVAQDLPQAGYYHFDIYCEVSEQTGGNDKVTETPQELDVKSTAETITIDKSGYFDVAPNGTPPAWYNKSLQGSGIINVNNAIKADRDVSINVTLPNGTTQSVVAGYIHLIYLGEFIEA
jgi:hypothetical protein